MIATDGAVRDLGGGGDLSVRESEPAGAGDCSSYSLSGSRFALGGVAWPAAVHANCGAPFGLALGVGYHAHAHAGGDRGAAGSATRWAARSRADRA